MTTTERERVLELFSAALELPAAEQSVFLKREGAEEPELIAEVLSLLKLDAQADAAGFLNASALQIEAAHLAHDVFNERVGESIGPFKIVRLIGTGGMGAIYLAEGDDDQYRRRVALKVIKRGMDTDYVLRRFGNERQILANLNHPNIARLYTGGATDDGLPYFVMEFIEGSPLTEYADRNRLSLNERLKLFRKVCAAVQYAHQNLVVHRDLKPSNILVTLDGEPKLLDFGIAKFLDATTDATVTEFRALTPEYASPEQIRGEPITTASDVYSLGVLLFELLTGRRPYRVTNRTPDEITKAVCEQEPPKPSAMAESEPPAVAGRLLSRWFGPPAIADGPLSRWFGPPAIAGGLLSRWFGPPAIAGGPLSRWFGPPAIADGRLSRWFGPPAIAGGRLSRWFGPPAVADGRLSRWFGPPATAGGSDLRGDLDNIALKALRKEPARRYASVAAFSEDIQHYLEGRPVSARKDTAWYRSSKFIGRHRVGVAAALIVLMTLIAGVIATAWEAHAAQVERARAERRFQDVRKLAGSFMFEFHDAIKDLPGALNARQLVVKRALEYLDGLAQEANGDRALQSELAQAYDKVGSLTFDVQQTIESHRKAMLLNEALVKADPQNAEHQKQLSESYNYLSDAMKIAGHSSEAIDFAKKSLAIFEGLALEHPADQKIKALLADRNLTLGIALADAGDLPNALQNDRAAMTIQQELVSTDPGSKERLADLSVMQSHISSALAEQGDFAGALEYNGASFAIVHSLFQSDPTSARYRRSMWAAFLNVARLQLKTGDGRAAVQSCAQALQFLKQLSSADPKDTGHRVGLAVTYQIYGNALAAIGRAEEAETDYQQAISIGEALVGEDGARAEASNHLARAYAGLARLLLQERRTAEAVGDFKKAQDLYELLLSEDPNNQRLNRESTSLASLANSISDIR
jgi:serine/threonine protein kinase